MKKLLTQMTYTDTHTRTHTQCNHMQIDAERTGRDEEGGSHAWITTHNGDEDGHNYHWAWADHLPRGEGIPHGLNTRETDRQTGRQGDRQRAGWDMYETDGQHKTRPPGGATKGPAEREKERERENYISVLLSCQHLQPQQLSGWL